MLVQMKLPLKIVTIPMLKKRKICMCSNFYKYLCWLYNRKKRVERSCTPWRSDIESNNSESDDDARKTISKDDTSKGRLHKKQKEKL